MPVCAVRRRRCAARGRSPAHPVAGTGAQTLRELLAERLGQTRRPPRRRPRSRPGARSPAPRAAPASSRSSACASTVLPAPVSPVSTFSPGPAAAGRARSAAGSRRSARAAPACVPADGDGSRALAAASAAACDGLARRACGSVTEIAPSRHNRGRRRRDGPRERTRLTLRTLVRHNGMAASDPHRRLDPPSEMGRASRGRADRLPVGGALEDRLEEEISRAGGTARRSAACSWRSRTSRSSPRSTARAARAGARLRSARRLLRELRRFDRVGRPSDTELLVVLPGADGPRGEIVARRVIDRLRAIKIEAGGAAPAVARVGRPRRLARGSQRPAAAGADTRRGAARTCGVATQELAPPTALDRGRAATAESRDALPSIAAGLRDAMVHNPAQCSRDLSCGCCG